MTNICLFNMYRFIFFSFLSLSRYLTVCYFLTGDDDNDEEDDYNDDDEKNENRIVEKRQPKHMAHLPLVVDGIAIQFSQSFFFPSTTSSW